jgi:hypothetical protein
MMKNGLKGKQRSYINFLCVPGEGSNSAVESALILELTIIHSLWTVQDCRIPREQTA